MTAAPDLLRVDRNGGVVSVVLSRPEKANALNPALVEALSTVIADATADGTRVMVLSGEGRNFSAGFDFGTLEDESDGDLLLRFVRIGHLLEAVSNAPFETVAFAHGSNFGAGADLFLACNRRFAAPNTTLRMPGLQFDLVLGTGRLAAIVGAERAQRILWSSETIGTETGLRLGIFEEVIDRGGWPGMRDRVIDSGQRLSTTAIHGLRARMRERETGDDLNHLVRSASAPGLKSRIQAYLAAQRRDHDVRI